VAPGGWSLQRHWDGEGPDTQQAVREGPWDFVVLQDFSVQAVIAPDALAEYGRRFAELARQVGAEPVLYVTWARQHMPEMQAGITRQYAALGRLSGSRLAPVGEAWKAALEARADLVLHTADRSHPTPAGSYLAACVFYATLTGRSPVGLPGRLVVRGEGGVEQVAADLDGELSAFLQQTAWRTVGLWQPAPRADGARET